MLMTGPCLIVGPNFSGRSSALAEILKDGGGGGQSFYLGPYAESGLSGIATTVAEELAFYSFLGGETAHDAGLHMDATDTILARPSQRVATLSGGEQTLLALLCFDSSRYRLLGVDTALEQLDSANRSNTLRYLLRLKHSERKCWLIDNRDLRQISAHQMIELEGSGAFALDFDRLIHALPRETAPTIEIRSLEFAYSAAVPVFADVSLTIYGGRAYRLNGPNGSGKTTFLKLLAGAVSPSGGAIYLDGKPYTPYRLGNEVLAWATQDPDHQWVSTSVEGDLAARIKAFNGRRYARTPQNLDIGGWTACFGIMNSAQNHLLDLPKAARKRLSWLWPLSGVLPWIALDEPTLGQDRDTTRRLARALEHFVAQGIGLLFVTHDDEFAGLLSHETLLFGKRIVTIDSEPVGPVRGYSSHAAGVRRSGASSAVEDQTAKEL